MSRGDAANIRRPKFTKKSLDGSKVRTAAKLITQAKVKDGAIWNGVRKLTSEVLKDDVGATLKPLKHSSSKDKKKHKKDKSDKKERKRLKKLLKKVKKVRQKHSSMKLQKLFRDRWARMGLVKSSPQASPKAAAPKQFDDVSTAHEQHAVHIQRMFRGHLARRSAAVIQQAREAGVMVAINGTVQGQSGWYQDFDQQVYYFAVDEQGVWWEVVVEKTWETYRTARSEELQPVPILIVKHGTKVGESGKYAEMTMDSFTQNPGQKLVFERWVVYDGTFTKK